MAARPPTASLVASTETPHGYKDQPNWERTTAQIVLQAMTRTLIVLAMPSSADGEQIYAALQ
jgi:hypothetical protein